MGRLLVVNVMALSLRMVARALSGEVSGRRVLAPGPGHSKRDRSLSIAFDRTAPDGFWVHSFAGDNWQTCRDHVKSALGITIQWTNPLKHHHPKAPTKATEPIAPNTQPALKIWQDARTIAGSSAEAYLTGRGLSLPPEAHYALRYHPNCPFKGQISPAMIAAMVDIHTNEFHGVHCTRLNPKDKAMLGPAKGAVVKLSPDEDVTIGLFLCEGIETGLALISIGFRPLWACLSANGLSQFPVLPGIESLTVFADNDVSETGQDAARECGARWHAARREARVYATPTPGTDFADRMQA